MHSSPQIDPLVRKQRLNLLRETFGVWFLSILSITGFGLLAKFIPFISQNLIAFVAATFLYLPAWALWRQHIGLHNYGLTTAPIRSGLLHFFVVVAVTFPPFVLGWSVFQTEVQDHRVSLDIDRMYRFDRNMEGRPQFPLETRRLHVWIEQDHLYLVWPTDEAIDVSLTLSVPDGAPLTDSRGISVQPNGIQFGDRGRLDVKMSGEIRWRRPNAGGIRLPLKRATDFTLATEKPVVIGRWRIAAELPVKTSRSSWWWLLMWLNQLVLVALPEEWFFRGYLQKRLDGVWSPNWQILGARLGWGWLASSLMFALGHLVHDPSPHRLAVFFPSLLFGWLRARTDSVLACTMYHAACNVLAQALAYTVL